MNVDLRLMRAGAIFFVSRITNAPCSNAVRFRMTTLEKLGYVSGVASPGEKVTRGETEAVQ